MTTCAACGKPVPDAGVICHADSGKLRRQLLDVPDLLAELDTTALRQAKTGDGQGSGNGVPWNEKAREAQDAIRNSLTTWARILLEETGGSPDDVRPTVAAWLADRTNTIRMREWADEAAHDIGRVIGAGWRAVDRPQQRWYAGPCGAELPATDEGIAECGTILWVDIDQVNVTCRGCGTGWSVLARREWLMTAAEDIHETASAIASVVTLMTRSRITASNIRNWAAEDRLAAVGQRDTARLYRVGDVIELVRQRDERKAMAS